jgi:hypothetical protein
MDKSKVLDAIVCEHIANKQRPVKLVFHNIDYSWEFMCGHADHTDFNKAQIIPLDDLLNQNQSLQVLKDLPINCTAEINSETGEWEFFSNDEEE